MTRKLFFSPLLAFALLGVAPIQAAAAVPMFSVDDDSAYAAGTKAMDERRWADAVAAFDQVINAKGKRADAALYWKAYALNKLDKQQLAADTCQQLHAQYKDSAWNEDCRALTVSLRIDRQQSEAAERMARDLDRNISRSISRTTSSSSSSHSSSDPDTDIKILALNAVMRENPGQAIPVVRSILSSDQPASVKQQAFFMLGQSKSPDADALLNDIVRGKMGPELQAQAIQSSAIYRGKIANDSLAEAYRNTNDPKVKRAVISAFFISKDDVHLVELARQEKDIEMKRRIVSELSIMHGKAATDYMMELLK